MKKKALISAVFAVLLVAGGAWAVGDLRVDINNSRIPTWIQPGLYIGNAASNVPSNQQNKITRILGSGLTYVNIGQLDAGCASSAAITVTGARIDDPCLLGHDIQTAAAGIPGSNVSSSCYVSATNAVKVKVCIGTTDDTAAVTVGDAGVNVIVISNQ